MHFRFWLLLGLGAFPLWANGDRLSPLAPRPVWQELAAFQESVTREEFERLLEKVYAPGGAARGLIEVRENRVEIVKSVGAAEKVTVRLAKDAASVKPGPRFWRTAAELPTRPTERPLAGLRVALDPGHLGGDWARMEERWFRLGESTPVREGDMALRVAERLTPLLTNLGAEVLHVRHAPGPTTPQRPADFRRPAREILSANGMPRPREGYRATDDPGRGGTVQFQSELLFYRMAEIRHRARVVNEELQPDVVLCLHFNAEAWGAPEQPEFTPRNHLHVLVNGCYAASELRLDDMRHDLLIRLLSGITGPEQALAGRMASVFARRAALPPWIYPGTNATRVSDNPYLWARNLLANRLYRCPVVFLEPYVMNNREVWERVQAGDYEGERVVAGSLRASIFREYAETVAEGLAEAFRPAK